jgi:hypothetical protein
MERTKWLEVEHTLRYFLYGKVTLTEEDYVRLDILKSSIIALFGIKHLNDNNEVFKLNMIKDINVSLDYFEKRFCNYGYKSNIIREFIKEYFE